MATLEDELMGLLEQMWSTDTTPEPVLKRYIEIVEEMGAERVKRFCAITIPERLGGPQVGRAH
jgi:hypothetical protein